MVQSNSKVRTVFSVIYAYGLWLASAALSAWLMLEMRLLFLVDLPMRSRTINHWAFSAIDKFGFIILGIIWLIGLIVSEEYFRRLIGRKFPGRRVLMVFVVEGVLLGLVYLWRALL
jgi:hypothetical protein